MKTQKISWKMRNKFSYKISSIVECDETLNSKIKIRLTQFKTKCSDFTQQSWQWGVNRLHWFIHFVVAADLLHDFGIQRAFNYPCIYTNSHKTRTSFFRRWTWIDFVAHWSNVQIILFMHQILHSEVAYFCPARALCLTYGSTNATCRYTYLEQWVVLILLLSPLRLPRTETS